MHHRQVYKFSDLFLQLHHWLILSLRNINHEIKCCLKRELNIVKSFVICPSARDKKLFLAIISENQNFQVIERFNGTCLFILKIIYYNCFGINSYNFDLVKELREMLQITFLWCKNKGA
jgi:hypothetical protein